MKGNLRAVFSLEYEVRVITLFVWYGLPISFGVPKTVHQGCQEESDVDIGVAPK